MEPTGPTEPHELQTLRVDQLRQAAEIYLRIAYPDGEPPDAVRRRLVWDGDVDAEGLLGKAPFEARGKSKSTGRHIYALRWVTRVTRT